MASEKKNVREGGLLAFNRDAKGLILYERFSGYVMFQLFFFSSVLSSEFLDVTLVNDKTKCSFSLQSVYFIIFNSHLTFNNF